VRKHVEWVVWNIEEGKWLRGDKLQAKTRYWELKIGFGLGNATKRRDLERIKRYSH
jgi:hypothetical protein